MTLNVNQVLFIIATILLVVAFIITVGWVDSGERDSWLVGGLVLFTAGHISWR